MLRVFYRLSGPGSRQEIYADYVRVNVDEGVLECYVPSGSALTIPLSSVTCIFPQYQI